MNREESVKILSAKADYQRMILGKYNQDVTLSRDAKTLQALEMGISALIGPQPDPITGLVPCGCGGKVKIWPSEPTQFTHVITDYEVWCTECAMTTGWVRGKKENAMKVWNTAMGQKGGAK